jgi:ABC-type glycerol-3-phosphate transport system substrate-binding protein
MTLRRAALTLAFLLPALAFAGGGPEKPGAQGRRSVSMWISTYTGGGQLELAQEEWYLTKATERFERAHPELTLTWSYQENQEEINQRLKAAAMARSGPDLINVWTGQQLFALRDIIVPLDDHIPPDLKRHLIGWDVVRDGFRPDGALLGVPISGSEAIFFYYNKSLVARAGLDFERNPPTTVAQLDRGLAAIKDTGTTPIVIDEGFPWLMLVAGFYWWAQQSGHEAVVSNSFGKTSFSADDGFLRAMTYYQSLYRNGFVNTDAASSSDTQQRFLQGQGAIRPDGNWSVSQYRESLGDDLGVFLVPDMPQADWTGGMLGGPGQAFVIANYSKVIPEAMQVIAFFNSKDEQLQQLKWEPKLPIRDDITAEDLGWAGDPIFEKLLRWNRGLRYWVDNSMQPEVNLEIMNTSALLLTGQLTPREFAERLDNKARDAN